MVWYNLFMEILRKNKLIFSAIALLLLVAALWIYTDSRKNGFVRVYDGLSEEQQNCISNGVDEDFFKRLERKGEIFNQDDNKQIEVVTKCLNLF